MRLDKLTENKILNSEEFKDEKEYWTSKLNGNIEMGGFPLEYPRCSLDKCNRKELSYTFCSKIFEGVKHFGKDSYYGMYILLLSSVEYVLYKYTNNEDLIVGVPIFKQKEQKKCINKILPLRNILVADEKYKEFLLKIKNSVQEANKNQNFPFNAFFESLDLVGCNDFIPLFKTIVLLKNIHDSNEIKGINADTIFKFNITESSLEIVLDYNTDIFIEELMYKMVEQIEIFINKVLENPNAKLSEIELLGEKDIDVLLNEFNNTQSDYDKEQMIHRLFESQAEKTPEDIAVVFGDEEITYKELNERSNSLARSIREKNKNCSNIIGIMVERSINMIVGIMAILKSGSAYLPIDISYPKQRIEYILNDSNTKILITQNHLASELDSTIDVIDIEDENNYLNDNINLDSINLSSDLAYVIYTSGSTGNPKGVMIEHKAINNFINGVKNKIDFDSLRSIVSVTTMSFDIFVLETLLPLVSGLKVVIANENEQINGDLLSKLLKKHNVEMIQTTPSRMQILINNETFFETLKVIMVGGEGISPILLEKIKSKSKARIYNMYGPTEATVWCSIEELTNETKITLGKPINNIRLYVLDEDNKLQPIGIPGELCIAGDGLARGYFNRPDLTKEKFITNLFDNSRVYKTGDLAKWLPNGKMEFLGRIDHQVKIRGFRIELGEIENALLKHKLVKEAVVVSKKDKDDEEHLCAYFLSNEELSVIQLRNYLSKSLPQYMIPSYFIRLDNMPTTPNGKIDRKLLPEINSNIKIGSKYVLPRNEIERKISDTWKDVLGVDKVGIYDSFFELGGDSIKAIEVSYKLLQIYTFKLEDIFEYNTVAELASHINIKKDAIKSYIRDLKKLKRFVYEPDIYSIEIKNQIEKYNKKNQMYRNIDLLEKKSYKNILLTGSTGYLGSHILYELLFNTSYDVYILLRGESVEIARNRIVERLRFYFEEDIYIKYKERIHILIGDISKDFIGLDEAEYIKLSYIIDCVINAAANVRHYGVYEDLYEVNVKGTERLLEFSLTNKKKDFNQISTASVGSEEMRNKEYVLFTEDVDISDKDFENQYLKTKLLAENIVILAREKGLNTNLIRMGRLVFDFKNGKPPFYTDENAFVIFNKAIFNLGILPNISRKSYDFTFVDCAAKAIVLLVDRKNLNNEIYHVGNPNYIDLIEFSELLNKNGLKIDLCEYDKFLNYLYENYNEEKLKSDIRNVLLHFNAIKIYDLRLNDKTSLILELLGFKWPKVNPDYIGKMILNLGYDLNKC